MEDKQENYQVIRYELQTFNYEANFNFLNHYKGARTTSTEMSQLIDMPDINIEMPSRAASSRFKGDASECKQSLDFVRKGETAKKKPLKAAFEVKKTELKEEMNDSDSEQNDGKKNRSILRNLSLRVKDMVNATIRVTYKDVAKNIVSEKVQEMSEHLTADELEKEMKNVKRRVYDALSVLINSGIFSKKEKFVYPTEESRKNGKRFNKQFEEYKALEEQLEIRQRNYAQKEEVLRHLMTRYAAVKSVHFRNRQQQLVSRSRAVDMKEREISKYLAHELRASPAMSLRSLPETKITWPFLALKLSNTNPSMKLFITNNKRTLEISSRQEIALEADMDLISRLEIPQKRPLEPVEAQAQELLLHSPVVAEDLSKTKRGRKPKSAAPADN